MTDNDLDTRAPLPVSRIVAADKLPAKGLRLSITLSDEETQAMCAFYDLKDVISFSADVHLRRVRGATLELEGRVVADVIQRCVVSLEPVETHVDETFLLALMPTEDLPSPQAQNDADGALVLSLDEDMPDAYDNGQVDVGALVLEHFSLGLEDYPQAADVSFDADKAGDGRAGSPFQDLAQLKERLKPH